MSSARSRLLSLARIHPLTPRWQIDRTLCEKGDLTASTEFKFEFSSFDRSYESYYGSNIKLRYFIRVTIERSGLSSNIVHEQDFLVQAVEALPEQNPPIKMEVGIEDCLHICFNYDRSRLFLNQAITGTIEFKLVRLKVHTMELSIIRKEMTGVGASAFSETDTLAKFELMDGLPVKAEVVPLRWYMGGIDLTPTFKSVDNKFSVKYFVNLVLIDEQERKYFKQQEMHFFRSHLGCNDFKQYIAPKKTKERLAKEEAANQ
jgi:vacuolar protein sorting-associated protein 26